MNSLDPIMQITINQQKHNKRDTAVDAQPSAESFADVMQQTQQSAAKPASATQESPKTAQPEKTERNVVNEFLEWMQMTPAEKLRDRILKELGLTEADLEAMDPEQRTQVEALIAQKIREEQELQNSQKAAKEDNKLFGA